MDDLNATETTGPPLTALARYLRAAGLTAAELARKARLHPNCVSRLASGESRPQARTARALIRASGGALTWEALEPLDGIERSRGAA